MNRLLILLCLSLLIWSCSNRVEHAKAPYLTTEIPGNTPVPFQAELAPPDMIIHKGLLGPALETYYYTLSDKQFQQFDVYMVQKENSHWSTPQKAFFNSENSEHGMSFSPDGNTLYFSSTRPVPIDSIPATWHLWKSEKLAGKWQEPSFIDIPNLRSKLVSHPTVTQDGMLYFHAANLDYSDMQIYHAQLQDGQYGNAERTSIALDAEVGKCTPYISPAGDYLLFATISEQLDLMISFPDGKGGWQNTRKLSDVINTNGQGNPSVTPDQKYLFYTTSEEAQNSWSVNWVNITTELVPKE